jgi:hypothetical protein
MNKQPGYWKSGMARQAGSSTTPVPGVSVGSYRKAKNPGGLPDKIIYTGIFNVFLRRNG